MIMLQKTLIAKVSSTSTSTKRVDNFYEISITDNGWVCSCPGYTHYGRCKHPALLRKGDYPGEVYLTIEGRTRFLYNKQYKNGWL